MDRFYKMVISEEYNHFKDEIEFGDFVENELDLLASTDPLPKLDLDEVITGEDYENFVERIIKEAGYEVETTKTTGDQGVDLIVYEKYNADIKVAIQCKFYSKPVGNKAVQEVKAGMEFYDCKYGGVCSNNTYTPAATSLANKLDIKLLSEEYIVDWLEEVLG
ncbi:MAG: restriction endonuclease [Alphaproteobacteria bacterium]|nr:restriction endonuclease [Alphaproteobacteria bacterium]